MNIIKSIRSKAQTHPAWGRFLPYAVPIIIIGFVLVIVIVTLVLLTTSVNQQVEIGASLLGVNLSDQTRTFVQLQRETLRMQVALTLPTEDFDADAAQLQYDLLTSRIHHMNRTAIDTVVPPVVAENIDGLNEMWNGLSPQIEAWIADPSNRELRATVTNQVIEFERLANITEIEFNRSRTATLVNFAAASRQIPATFGIAAASLLALVLAILFGFYRYIRQVQAAEAARQSSQFKDQFLAVMSHELRTPLNAIIGFLGILKMTGGLQDRSLHMVERSQANAERLLTLIDDILDMSKIEAGRFEIHPEAIAPKELSARWKAQMEILAGQKGLKFNLRVDSTLPNHIYTDPDALTKIVTNLLSNAFKFTKEGEVNLDIAASGKEWTIRVADTGIGIPEEKQETIFESFRQVDNSTRRAYGGTGLGLSIVKQLTNLLNGQIVVQSQVGVGTTFVVTLPLVVPETVANSVVEAVKAPA
jgi:signal transduction histidine kinase